LLKQEYLVTSDDQMSIQ